MSPPLLSVTSLFGMNIADHLPLKYLVNTESPSKCNKKIQLIYHILVGCIQHDLINAITFVKV